MPPKVQFSREDVRRAAFEITRAQGVSGLNARAIAAQLGCSTQPIFRAFRTMEDLRKEMLGMAMERYSDYIARSATFAAKPYLGTGMAYIRFAREERALFQLLFMRDRVREGTLNEGGDTTIDYVLSLVMKNTGLSREQAAAFHRHLWVYVHGLASMIVTGFLTLSEAEVSALLSDAYRAFRRLYHLPPLPEEATAEDDQPR